MMPGIALLHCYNYTHLVGVPVVGGGLYLSSLVAIQHLILCEGVWLVRRGSHTHWTHLFQDSHRASHDLPHPRHQ